MAAKILKIAFDGSPAAACAEEFGVVLRRHSLAVAAGTLLAVTILVGCGATGSSEFAGSPSGGGSGTGGTGNSSSAASGTATSVQQVTVNSTSLAAGTTSPAAVTLNAAAPAGGATVALTSSNTSAANVPASVTVAQGQTSTGFTVTTGSVSAETSLSITAAYNNTFAGVNLSVKASAAPPASPAISVSVSPATLSLVAETTQQFSATVTGSTNTAVSWTATGGTITGAGLFTAPNVSTSTNMAVTARSQADPARFKTVPVTVTPPSAPPPSGGEYSGSGPVASWKAYQYLDTDGFYHQAIWIYNSQGAHPVIGYSFSDSECKYLGDRFNDFFEPIGNGFWWFINKPQLIYVRWVWYGSSIQEILQQTPCIDYSGAPKYN